MRRLRLAVVPVVVGLLAGAAAVPVSGAPEAVAGKGRGAKLTFVGTVKLSRLPGSGRLAGDTLGDRLPNVKAINRALPNRQNSAHLSAAHVPTPSPTAIAATNPGFSGFSGLTHRDQRLAGGGNQFSLEPPDQGLAVGQGFVVEAVNDAIAVYGTNGRLNAGPVTANAFFKLPPIVTRDADGVIVGFGPFVFDPRAYFDPDSGRFFVVYTEIDTDPVTGDFLGHGEIELAVSQTSDPTGTYNVYRLDATNDGSNGTPNHSGCPCFGDFPQVGADTNGLYITTNEFSILGSAFNGAQIYAISKAQLVAGAVSPTTVLFDGDPTPLAEGVAGTVQPAVTPTGRYETAAGGAEYFLSNLDFTNRVDDRIAVWALTNTSSLNSTPRLTLRNVVLDSESYGIPPNAEQKDGPLPLGTALSPGSSVHTPLISTGDDRFGGTVTFAAGKLWGAVSTIVKQSTSGTKAAVAWFAATPSVAGGTLTATIANQGYVSVAGEHVFYPSIGVNDAGNGVITMALVSENRFPSTAYVPVDASGTELVHIAGVGTAPADGFTGYIGGNVERWGDYSAAPVNPADGSVWGATEFIPNAPRTSLANWGTFVSRVAR
jgi:hypothetical protein